MTTSQSPDEAIRKQARGIVQHLAYYRWPYGKDEIVIGIVMDDKTIRMTLPKKEVTARSSEELTEFIFKYMKGVTTQ